MTLEQLGEYLRKQGRTEEERELILNFVSALQVLKILKIE